MSLPQNTKDKKQKKKIQCNKKSCGLIILAKDYVDGFGIVMRRVGKENWYNTHLNVTRLLSVLQMWG